MPRIKRTRRKKQRRRKRTGTGSTSHRMSEALYEGLIEAERLDRRGESDPARELLDDLDRRYPDRPEVLTALVNVYYELNDIPSYQFACQRLVSLRPDDPDVRLMLAGSCLANGCPALALRNFRLFIEHWPDDVRADDVRNTVAELGIQMDELLASLGLSGEEGLQLAAMHEEVLCSLEQGEWGQTRNLAEQLLKRQPHFLPALNNLGEAHFREGRVDQAIAAAQRVLQLAPENLHALANLTRYLCLSGRAEEGKPWAERLKSVESTDSDVWVKKAETFSFIGDDEAVLHVFNEAQRRGNRSDKSGEALLNHLAAVAAMRLGQEKDARRYWKRALKLVPWLEVARANLEDLKKPVGQRHAPWAYDLNHWIPQSLGCKLASRIARAERRGKDKAVVRETRQYLRKHPQVAAVLPLLLDRGDPAGRQFALSVAALTETPELLEALRDFALGRRGPDGLRFKAAERLCNAGVLPAGTTRLWSEGCWKEVLMLGFEIHGEPVGTHPSEVEEWAYQATIAIRNRDGEEAERLLEQALEVLPDAPDLLNNLATAYRLQGRDAEWKRLIHEVHQRYPDYFFGRVNIAFEHLRAHEIDQAREMLRPLLFRKRLHYSEFASLCSAQMELSLAEKNTDAVRSWLDMWEQIDPEHPDVRHWRLRLSSSGLRRVLRLP